MNLERLNEMKQLLGLGVLFTAVQGCGSEKPHQTVCEYLTVTRVEVCEWDSEAHCLACHTQYHDGSIGSQCNPKQGWTYPVCREVER